MPPVTLNTRLSRIACQQERRRSRTERKAYRHLPLPANRPHQQQPGQVGTDDQQHHGHGEKQGADQRTCLLHRFLTEWPDHGTNA